MFVSRVYELRTSEMVKAGNGSMSVLPIASRPEVEVRPTHSGPVFSKGSKGRGGYRFRRLRIC